MFNGQKVCEKIHSAVRSVHIDQLEERRMFAWGAHAVAMDQDAAVSRFPSIDGRGYVIANIDSGMSTKHSKLQGRQFVNPGEIAGNGRDDDNNGYRDDVTGWNYVGNNNNPADDQGHGTMTAGVMTAARWTNTGNNRGYSGDGKEYQGLATAAKVLNLKVVTSGMSFSISNVEKALQYVINNRSRFNIAAVNLSIDVGSGGYSVIKDELATLWNSGVWIAASSGNGYNTNGLLAWPAMGPYAAGIGAMNPDGTVAPVGSRGGDMDFVAPGDKVPFLDRGNSYWLGGKGTSYSAPFGTAAGVLIKQVNPRFSSAEIADILRDSASQAWDSVSRQNYRRLDLDSAIELAFSRSGRTISRPIEDDDDDTPQAPSGTSSRSAFGTIQAESLNDERGVTKISGGVTSLDSGDWIKYDDVNFGSGASSVTMRVAVPRSVAGRTIEVRVDSASGPIIGRVTTKATDGTGDYDAMGAAITKTSGTHDLYLTFSGSSIGNIDSLTFGGLSTSSTTTPSTSTSTSGTRSAYSTIQAESLTSEQGATKISGGVGSVDSGDWIKYGGIDFGSTGATSFAIRAAVPSSLAGKKIQVRVGSPTGTIIGSITTRATDGYGDYDEMTTSITRTTGVKDIYLTFSGGGTIGNLDSFVFRR
jgi:hypothetical protein